MEQTATGDSGLLLTFDIPEGDQVSPFSTMVSRRWSADVCIKLCNSFRSRFCKVPPQLCDDSTVIHDICSSSSTVVVVVVCHILSHMSQMRSIILDCTEEYIRYTGGCDQQVSNQPFYSIIGLRIINNA